MAATREFCPYVGLQPFTEADRAYFFGREREIRLVGANLFAAKLTVLYGESGVGKSSLLMAGVVPELRKKPRTAVAMFRDWQRPDAPAMLKRAVVRAADETAGASLGLDAAAPLDELLAAAGKAIGGTVLVLLDQFEEYFLYFPPGGAGDEFDAEFARAVNRRDVNAGFVLSIREDSLSKLDRFRARIPTVLANPLRIRHLRPQDARDAVNKPLEVYNRRAEAAGQPVTIEPALVDALIEQTVSGRVSLAQTGAAADGPAAAGERVEAPYLQLVLTRLWEEEARARSPVLRAATLQSLGGAARIVRTHLDQVMSTLAANDQALCAEFFDRLVTPSGTKIACRLDDLKQWAGDVRAQDVERVVAALAAPSARILRAIDPLPGQPPQYEIFHDVLAAGVADWRTRYVEARNLEEAQASAKAALEQRRARLFKLWAAPAIIFLVAVSGLMLYLYVDAEAARKDAVDAEQRARTEASEAAAARARAEDALAEVRRAAAEAKVQAHAIAEVTRGAPQLRTKIDEAVTSASLVYVQFADPGQRELADRLRLQLQKSRYQAPGVEKVGTVPSRTELRYFRTADKKAALDLADLLKRWNFGALEPRFVQGYEARAQLQQFEIWLARPDPSEIARRVQSLNAPVKAARSAALEALETQNSASPLAIAETLTLFSADRIDALSPEGRFNALYFLSRTAPLAWEPKLEASGREVVARLEARQKLGVSIGDSTRNEIERFLRVLDAAKAGEAAPLGST